MRSFYTLRSRDVGRATIKAFGKRWRTDEFIGQVLKQDVGKRVYRVGDFLQVENDSQLARRLGNPARHVRGRFTTLRNMALVTIRKLPNGVVKITGRKMAGKKNYSAPQRKKILKRRSQTRFYTRPRKASKQRNSMIAWNVYLRGRRIDTIFYQPDYTADEIRRALIGHDGYDPAIKVKKQPKTRKR